MLKDAFKMNIIPVSQVVKLSQKDSFLTVPVPPPPEKSSKPEIRTKNLQETDSECIPPQHADLFGFGLVVFGWFFLGKQNCVRKK